MKKLDSPPLPCIQSCSSGCSDGPKCRGREPCEVEGEGKGSHDGIQLMVLVLRSGRRAERRGDIGINPFGSCCTRGATGLPKPSPPSFTSDPRGCTKYHCHPPRSVAPPTRVRIASLTSGSEIVYCHSLAADRATRWGYASTCIYDIVSCGSLTQVHGAIADHHGGDSGARKPNGCISCSSLAGPFQRRPPLHSA